VLDEGLKSTPLNLTVLVPQRRITFGPRFDYQLNSKNTLVAGYAYAGSRTKNAGIGGFSLPSQAYDMSTTQHALQLSESMAIGKNTSNETRFEVVLQDRKQNGIDSAPGIRVPDAFIGGGSAVGAATNGESRWNLSNQSRWVRSGHTFKAGVQLRGVRIEDTSPWNFGGTFTFAGKLAPELDSNDQVVLGLDGQPRIVPISTLESYRRTLLFSRMGLSAEEARSLGGGASQYSVSAGEPAARISQYEAGVFLQDDWRLAPNLTWSMGLRYEAQTRIRDKRDFAPRMALAWSPRGGASDRRTTVRAGFGTFYDRFSESFTLTAARYNGASQQQYILSDPTLLDSFPAVPPLKLLTAFAVPQTTTRVAEDMRAPYTLQSSLSIERELPFNLSFAATFLRNRTVHVLRSRDINAPENGTRPQAGQGEIFQYEASGRFDQNQLVVNIANRAKKVTFYTTYILNKAKSDSDGAESFPANSHDLTGEYGRSILDVRHTFYWGVWVKTPLGFDLNSLLVVRSGVPFNITTGQDSNSDSLYTERPAFATGLNKSSDVATRFGVLDLNPSPGQAEIPRNLGTGPVFAAVNLRIGKTIGPMLFALQVQNLFNRVNRGQPVGNLSSPLFGRSLSSSGDFGIGGNPAGNRRVEAQVFFNF